MTQVITADEWNRRGGSSQTKAMKRVVAGSKAQKSGAAFEDCLSQANRYYESRGVLAMEQLPVPTRALPPGELREGSKFSGMARMLSAPASCDYFGAFGKIPDDLGPWWLRGRLVMMEAKFSGSTTKRSLDIHESHGLRPHQLQRLHTYAEYFGAISVIVACVNGQRGVLTPDGIARAHVAYITGKARSIPLSDFTPYEKANGGECGLIEDWLRPVLSWCKATMGKSGT